MLQNSAAAGQLLIAVRTLIMFGVISAGLFQSSVASAGIDILGLDPKHLVRWKVASEKVIFVENEQQDWYRLDLATNCINLETSADLTLVKETGGRGGDDFAIVVNHQKCSVLRYQHIPSPPWETFGIGIR